MTAAFERPTIAVRIMVVSLAGWNWDGYRNIHLGIQRGKDLEQLVRNNARTATFVANVEWLDAEDGLDYRESYVHGRRGEPLLYLCWATNARAGDFEMVARAKLGLNDVDPALLTSVARNGGALIANVDLVDRRGNPASGSIRPPNVH